MIRDEEVDRAGLTPKRVQVQQFLITPFSPSFVCSKWDFVTNLLVKICL
jgi:hypothetical protein